MAWNFMAFIYFWSILSYKKVHTYIIFNSVRIYMTLSDQNPGAGLTIIFLYLELFCRNRLM